MKVELIHPPHFNSTDDRLDPPLGLLYIASYLKSQIPGIEITINDLSGISSAHDIEVGEADVYGITVYCCSIDIARNILSVCRSCGRDDAVLVAGGAHMTERVNALGDLPDFVVAGYGEMPMTEICRGRTGSNKILTGSIPVYHPPIDWSLVDINSYSRVIDGEKSLPMLTTRGCPFSCNFCGLHGMRNAGAGAVRILDDNIVFAELERIKNAGINAVNIQDDIFTLYKPRLIRILNGIKELGMTFRCMGKAGHDSECIYEMLADAGCKGVAWGIESGSQRILDLMNKKQMVEDGYNVIKWCKKYGMDSRAFFVLGFPGETVESIEETRAFIMKADPDQYFISKFVPYPGTPVYADPESFGIIEMSYDFRKYYQVGSDGLGGNTISTKLLHKDVLAAHEHRLKEWLKKNKPIRGKNLQEYEK